MVAQFRHQHSELIHLADAILKAAADKQPDELARLRLAFSRAVNEHVADEAVVVQGAVRRGLIPAQLVTEHDRIVRQWRGDVALCNSEWPTRRAVETPDGFLRRFRPLVEALRTAVAFEENQFLAPIKRAA
jgi:hypothetical protein